MLLIWCQSIRLVKPEKVDAFDVLTALIEGIHVYDQFINGYDKEVVRFWYDAIAADDDLKCTLDYLRQLEHQLEEHIKYTQMSNVEELHEHAKLMILSSCGEKLIDHGQILGSYLVGQEILLAFGFEYNRWLHEVDDTYPSLRKLAEWMLRLIGPDKRDDRTKFFQAWRNGPCKYVLTKVSGGDMLEIVDFVNILSGTMFNALKLQSIPFKFYIPIVQACLYFEYDDALQIIWSVLQERNIDLEHNTSLEAMLMQCSKDLPSSTTSVFAL